MALSTFRRSRASVFNPRRSRWSRAAWLPAPRRLPLWWRQASHRNEGGARLDNFNGAGGTELAPVSGKSGEYIPVVPWPAAWPMGMLSIE